MTDNYLFFAEHITVLSLFIDSIDISTLSVIIQHFLILYCCVPRSNYSLNVLVYGTEINSIDYTLRNNKTSDQEMEIFALQVCISWGPATTSKVSTQH